MNPYKIALAPLVLAVAVVLLALLISWVERTEPPDTPSEATDASIYEGQGNLTFGCSLWQPLSVRPYDEETKGVRPLADFYIEGSNEEAVLIYARSDGIVIVSGLRCGISVDWTRFPREGN